jgi:hypothetical protein
MPAGTRLLALAQVIAAPDAWAPAAATNSWDTIGAASPGSVLFRLLDDQPRRIRIAGRASLPSAISLEHAAWIERYFEAAYTLRHRDANPRFSTALSAYHSWNHTESPRLALAHLWVGLEALFASGTSRITAGLASRIPLWVPSVTEGDVRRLYGLRCDAVHGRSVSDMLFAAALADTCELLRTTLARCIETSTLPVTTRR